jgi:hypothetical protein
VLAALVLLPEARAERVLRAAEIGAATRSH